MKVVGMMRHSIMFLSILLILGGSTNCEIVIRSYSVSDPVWSPSMNQILISPNSTFAAGFLASSSSPNLYTFSVWYHSTVPVPVPVWSAGAQVSSSASLLIKPSGELTLSAAPSAPNLWPSSPKAAAALELLDTGNLVFGDWASFAFPTNTFLPTQNITNATVLSTRNAKFLFLDSKQLVYRNRSGSYWDAGGAFLMLDAVGKISQQSSGPIISSDMGDPRKRRLTLDEDGNLRLYSFDPDLGRWAVVWRAVENLCRIRGTCGDYAICTYEPADAFATCDCPPGFTKASSSDSCDRSRSAEMGTKFISLDYVSFVAGSNHTSFPVSTLSECQNRCLANLGCEGYQFRYDGSPDACVLLLGTLRDGLWSPDNENVLFLRAEPGNQTTRYIGMTSLMETSCPVRIRLPSPPEESSETTRNVVIISTLFAAELLSGAFFFWTFLKKYTKYRDMARTFGLEVMPGGGPKRFTYGELRDATANFCHVIGKGGFGIVYRGTLSDGRAVAIKSLKAVAGGDPDFWAEVTIIARMHHLNLVRLWGFCTDKGRRDLVYEYVPNGSLDKFLFQQHESPILLDWNIRYRIALGVARAIAYLHEECLEWVLHCDIKPENILLGDDFCPKVSDFGLAKLKKKEDMISKSRIRGTRGYLAPEWVRPEAITSKSDVYSFGLVLLEIVTGKRNFDQENNSSGLVESSEWYFPSWAYDQIYNGEMNDDILDPRIKHSYDSHAHFDMVNRMLKTAMACIQDRAENRPTMGKVAKMLEGTVEITQPKKPSTYVV